MSKFIINKNRSQEIVFEDLRRDSKEKGKSIIPFIGAGASFILGLPSWEDLVKGYADKVGYPHDVKKQYETNGKSWPKVTEEIYKHSKSNDSLYTNYLTGMHPTKARWHSLHFELVEKFPRIITTNYDYAIENAFRKCHKTKQPKLLYFPDSLDAMKFEEGAIAYMHGQIGKGRFVFREEEYQLAYIKHNIIHDFLSQVIKLNYLLFIGFSFDDQILQEKVYKIVAEKKNEMNSINAVYADGIKFDQPKLFITLAQKDIETTFSNDILITAGISDDAKLKYFKVVDGRYELVVEDGIDKESFFTEKVFNDEYNRIKFNIERLTFLNNLEFDILLYNNSEYTEIEDILEKICKPYSSDPAFTSDLPDFSKAG